MASLGPRLLDPPGAGGHEPGSSGGQLFVRLGGKTLVSATGGTIVAPRLNLLVQSKGKGYWAATSGDVIAPPTDAEGGLFSETNDNSVAILRTYGTARVLLAGDAEAREEEYMANGPYMRP